MLIQEKYPAAAHHYLADRMVIHGGRETAIEIEEPQETVTQFYPQNRSEQEKHVEALIFASYIPFLFLADIVSEESEGALVLLVCCGIAFFLFGITGWRNEEIR